MISSKSCQLIFLNQENYASAAAFIEEIKKLRVEYFLVKNFTEENLAYITEHNEKLYNLPPCLLENRKRLNSFLDIHTERVYANDYYSVYQLN